MIDNIRRTDWNVIREEYIAGGVGQRELAERHGVAYSAVRRRAAEEQWVRLRTEAVRGGGLGSALRQSSPQVALRHASRGGTTWAAELAASQGRRLVATKTCSRVRAFTAFSMGDMPVSYSFKSKGFCCD